MFILNFNLQTISFYEIPDIISFFFGTPTAGMLNKARVVTLLCQKKKNNSNLFILNVDTSNSESLCITLYSPLSVGFNYEDQVRRD